MNMPGITVVVGILLIVQGLGFYLGTQTKSGTALIPTWVGLPLLVLGLVAFNASARKHAMHVAAAVSALGCLAALGRLIQAGVSFSPAGISVLLMVLLTGALLFLCVKSFVDARRRRSNGQAPFV